MPWAVLREKSGTVYDKELMVALENKCRKEGEVVLASSQGRLGSGMIRGIESVQAEETNYETEAGS